MEDASPDVFVEVVNIIADVNRRSTILLDSEIITSFSWVEEPVRLAGSRARREYAVSLTEDIFHALCLHFEVPVCPLDNTERIDP